MPTTPRPARIRSGNDYGHLLLLHCPAGKSLRILTGCEAAKRVLAMAIGVIAIFVAADKRPTRTEADSRADSYRRLDVLAQCNEMQRRRQISSRECMKAEGY
jgi:hypothetical protein